MIVASDLVDIDDRNLIAARGGAIQTPPQFALVHRVRRGVDADVDLTGFASSYAMYDVLAKRVPAYGYVYPFIELGLGVWYLLGWQPILVNWVTLIVMAFSSIGVILAVVNKQKIRCACLGAGFNLPMSTVTIIEDLLMAAMALWIIV